MLCEKIRNIIKIAEVCLSDSRAFSSGMTFDGVTIAETGCIADKSILNGRITCHGITDSGELLVSTGNMRYFFTLKDYRRTMTGGTDLLPAYREACEKDFDGIIVLTDGYLEFPDSEPKPTVWAMPESRNRKYEVIL